MGLETLRRLLEEKKWELCAGLAEDLFLGGELSYQEKAFVAYARCRSLSNLERFDVALEPGQIAVFLAKEVKEYELLGLSLLELAYIQGSLPGHEHGAVESLRTFVEYRDRYPKTFAPKVNIALFNLGATERALGMNEEALTHLGEAWQAGKRSRDEHTETYRQNYSWQSMTVENLELARQLIVEGEHYVAAHPGDTEGHTHLLNEKARYALLSEDYPTAAALAMWAIELADGMKQTGPLALALITLSQACENVGDLDTAMSMGFWAHIEALQADQPELVDEVRRGLRGMRLQNREVADRLMAKLVRPA